jgi:hypothetical protein
MCGRTRARTVAMPNSTPPSMYGIPTATFIYSWQGPDVQLPRVPIDDPEVAVDKLRRRRRQSGQHKSFDEDESRLNAPRKPEHEVSHETKPTSLFHLPGIEPGDAEQDEEAHCELESGDDDPRGGRDRRKLVTGMDRLNAGKNGPCYDGCCTGPSDGIRCR